MNQRIKKIVVISDSPIHITVRGFHQNFWKLFVKNTTSITDTQCIYKWIHETVCSWLAFAAFTLLSYTL